MSLRRAEIRRAVVALLKGKTQAEERVFANRSKDPQVEEIPCININYRSEDTTELTTAPKRKGRDLVLGIEIIATGDDEDQASDLMDAMCEQVECILTRDDTLGKSNTRKNNKGKPACIADIIELDNVQFDFTSDGKKPVAAARLNWIVKYDDAFPRDRTGQEVNEFLRAFTDWNIGTANDPDPEAQDEVNFPRP